MRFFGSLTLALLLLTGLTAPAAGQTAEDVNHRRAQLEAELVKVEEEIAQQTKLLQSKQKESASFQRDVDILNAQIERAKLSIRAKEIEIVRLGGDIQKKVGTIQTLDEQIDEDKLSLAELLRKTQELDDISLLEIVLTKENLSGLFADTDAFSFVEQGLRRTFADLRDHRRSTETEKSRLETKQAGEIDARQVIEGEKRLVEKKESERRYLLSLTKSQENAYQTILANREAERQRLKTALFKLRGSAAIPFGQAVELATLAYKQTGVRPAFLLAMLTQESRLGENIGTCNRPEDPPEKRWQAILKPSRDYEPYLRITKELGLSPDGLPLSCPYAGGWGGAMGPAQFIPSTWQLYKTQIAAVTGSNPPNPWLPHDAFIASALYLRDLGAAAGGYTAERTAALKYYAGGNWAKSSNAFYGDSVMNLVAGYQEQIDFLQNN